MSENDSGSGGSAKGRRKRVLRSSSTRSAYSAPQYRVPSDANPSNNYVLQAEEVAHTVSCLSSPLAVFQAVSSFDSRKRTIVESMGFGGILSLPSFSNDNSNFSVWLLKRMKWYKTSLTIGDNFSITLTAEHIGKISGLPFSGIDISENSLETVSEKLSFKKFKLAFLGSGNGIVEAAEKYVQEDLPTLLTKQHSDQFKIAFVIFVMGRFLAPSPDHPDGNTNFWGALHNPDEICSYNWGAYVLTNLMDAARLLNWVVPYKKPLNSVAGCPLILQIFYLDNLDFGDLNLPHDIIPRWNIFSAQSLDAMIEADKCIATIGSSSLDFGRTKEIRVENSCYSFSTPHQITTAPNCSTPAAQVNATRGESKTPEQTFPERILHSNTGYPLPTIFKSAPDLQNGVLDFSVFITEKYQGKVDRKILDDLKIHNAMCLKHLSSSYHSLAAEIVNENAKIAMKMIDHIISSPANNTPEPFNQLSTPRRRRLNDFISATDSSTEGEDNTTHSKMPKTRLGIGPAFGYNKELISGPVIHTSHNVLPSKSSDDKVIVQSHTPCTDVPVFSIESPCCNQEGCLDVKNDPGQLFHCGSSSGTRSSTPNNSLDVDANTNTLLSQPHPAAAPSSILCTSAVLGVTPTLKESVPKFEAPSSALPPVFMKTTDKVRDKDVPFHACLNIRDIDTPEPTIKMAHYSPNASPTTENKMYSGACLSIKILDSLHGIDLNTSSFEAEYNSTSQPKKVALPGPLSLSHWEMHFKYPDIELHVISGFIQWLSNTTSQELQSNWIVHYSPRFIKICGSHLKDQFAMNNPITFDLFDICIRRIKQLDSSTYPADIPLLWRHLLESDYALHVLGYENPVENKFIRDQFVGPTCNYELSRCRMFYVPVYVHGKWWCYAWDFKIMAVYIIDPSVGHESDSLVIKNHYGTLSQLSKSLSTIVDDLFTGWAPKFPLCSPKVLRFAGMPYNSNDTGLLTLFCIVNFDGSKLVISPTETNLYNFKAYLLYQLMEIKHNGGLKPTAFVQYID